MTIAHINSSEAPLPAGPYSHSTSVGGFVFTSGTLGKDLKDGTAPEGFRDEVKLALGNLVAVPTTADASVDQVVRTACLLTDVDQLAVFNDEYSNVFGTTEPARSTFIVTLSAGVRVGVEATAFVG